MQSRLLSALLGSALLLLFSSTGASASPPLAELPAALQDWTDWVRYAQQHRACPLMAGSDIDDEDSYLCAWPGRLDLRVDASGARFEQVWTLYQDGAVPLPGNDALWPQQVRVDGAAAAVVKRDELPVLWLKAGTHRIEGELLWQERPESIALDARIARISLSVDGKPVFPIQRDTDALWLGRADSDAQEADSLDVQVFRLLSDQVPQRLITQMRMQVSGKGREESLAAVLPADFAPVSLSGDLVARYEGDGSLHVQVRPGTHTITLTARALKPIAEFAATTRAAPWPADEIWSYQSQAQLRVTDASGPAQIDPAMAEVPESWRSLPAFEMSEGAVLSVSERSRGMSDQDQNRLSLYRQLWLDYSGAGWTGKDQINGSLLRDWRLDLAPPYLLTRADENGFALLVTKGANPGATGVEVRERNLQLSASTRLHSNASTLPVTGWQHPFESVSTHLNFPPGYELIAAPGADRVPGAWLDQWDLLDVFIAALIAFLCALAFGRLAALIPLAYLLLAWHLPDAPRITLLAAVGLGLLATSVTQGDRLPRWLGRFGKLAALLLLVVAVPFAAQQIRQALYPQLESSAQSYGYGSAYNTGNVAGYAAQNDAPAEIALAESMPMGQQAASPPPPPAPQSQAMERIEVTGSRLNRDETDAAAPADQFRAQNQAPQKAERRALKRYASNTIVQAGGGEPTWQWRHYQIEIAGPVLSTQSVRLLISPPWMTRLARVLIALLMGLTLAMVLRASFAAGKTPGPRLAVALVTALVLCTPTLAAADVPTPELLEQLGERVLAMPDCAPDCGYIARADVHAEGARIVAALELHAAERVAVPLPGNEKLLDLEALLLDGVDAAGAVRDENGTLWLMLPRGVHRAELRWRAANADSIPLRFALAPGYVQFVGEGWQASGIDQGQLTTGSLELTRQAGASDVGSRAGVAQSFPPFVIVTRELRFDLDWSLTTSVMRVSPGGVAFSVPVPLLAGERVMSTGFQINQGVLTAPFGEGEDWVQWESRLDAVDLLTIGAPDQSGRSEIWRLNVSPTWNVLPSGVPGVHPETGMYQFHPLPGETLTLKISRPVAVQGNTIAIDSATIHSVVGKRSTEHTLSVNLRATQGGQHPIGLPVDAEVMELTSNGQRVNIRPQQGRLSLPVTPGVNAASIRWRDAVGAGTVTRTPQVTLNADASNLNLVLGLPGQRWVIASSGPRVGPAVLYWGELLVMMLIAYGVSRTRRTPLKLLDWLLLGIGFSMVSWWALVCFAAWLFALDWRSRLQPDGLGWRFNFVQLGLLLLTVIAGGALYSAIHNGLLGSPDLHVTGNGSSAYALRWFHDQTDSAMPIGTAISLPMWLYRALMLLWAFWMAWSLIRWLRWGLQCYATQGVWRAWFRKKPAVAAAQPEPQQSEVDETLSNTDADSTPSS